MSHVSPRWSQLEPFLPYLVNKPPHKRVDQGPVELQDSFAPTGKVA